MNTILKPRAWLTPILRTLIWFVLSIAQIIDIILVREAVKALAQTWQVGAVEQMKNADPLSWYYKLGYIVQTIDYTTMIVLGIMAVTFTVLMDYYFRASEKKNDFPRRMAIVVGIEVGIALLSLIIINVFQLPLG